jgi:DnaJ-class molecular chaperone
MSKHTTFVRVQGNESMSYYETVYICDYCNGDGWYVSTGEEGEPIQVQCEHCNGQGRWTERC